MKKKDKSTEHIGNTGTKPHIREVGVGGKEFIETTTEREGADGIIETHVGYETKKRKYKATSRYNPETKQWEKLT